MRSRGATSRRRRPIGSAATRPGRPTTASKISSEDRHGSRLPDVEIPRRTPQVLAAADHHRHCAHRRALGSRPRLGRGAVHLHLVLMKILRISAYYHDAAAALLIDGQVAAAAQEERFTRREHDSSFPHHAIRACLEATGTRAAEIATLAFYD